VAAIRVAGADAAAVLPVLMQATEGADVEMTPAQVAGKDVTLIASDTPYYAYPAGEVVWLIQAEEPGLTEILTALP
jgi:hypothetical protein